MNMERCRVLAWAILILSSNLYSQNTNVGTITGSAVDEATNRPLEFVNVALHNKIDSALVTGTVTDKKGKFELGNISAGDYFIRFRLIGYREKMTRSFIIDPQHAKPNLGTVPMIETVVNLDEVLVTGEKALFNNSIDRKVYNVDQDILSKSGSASQVLQNVPSVEVDIDGNVSLRGSSNVLMLINGKNSSLMGRSRAEVLQQMPASTIEKIEVITNPSAKYKPDGTSGIINIVLKENTSLGLNGSIATNVGNQDRYNGTFRLSFSPGFCNLHGSYSFRQDSRNRINSDTRQQFDAASSLNYFRQDLMSYASPISHLITLGVDFDFDDGNSVGASGNYFYNSFTRTDYERNELQNSDRVLTEQYDRNRLDFEYQKDYGFTVFFQHKFPKEDHSLRFEFAFSGHPEKEDNHFTNLYQFPPASAQFDNTLIKPLENKSQLSLDYSDPLGANSKLEAGYAGELNHGDYNFLVDYFDFTQQQFVTDVGKTNRFIFNETIHALYATYEHSFGDFRFLGGLRTEAAYNKSNLVARDSIVTSSYFNVYPTLHLSYKLNDASELQLNYSRRVHRPESEDLNPFPEYRDPRNITSGNPRLLPEYVHSVELGCRIQNDLLSVIPSIYYRYTSNTFTRVVQAINDTTLLTTHTNLSNDQAAGMEVIVSGNLGDMLTSHISANAFYSQIDASNLGYSSNRSVVTWSGAMTVSLNLTKNSNVQVNSNYRSSRLTPQGEFLPSYAVNMGVRQIVLEGKLSLILTVADLFNTLKRKIELNTPLLNQTVINTRDSRIVYFGVTYYFGGQTKKTKEEPIHYDDGL